MGRNQYGEYIPDEKFIEVWNKLKSPTAVAKELGVNIRNAMMRRRTLEVKYNIVLDTDKTVNVDENVSVANTHLISLYLIRNSTTSLILGIKPE